MTVPSARGSTLRPEDSQAMFLDDVGPAWRRTPIGLWLYAGLGALRIILSGLSIVLLRR